MRPSSPSVIGDERDRAVVNREGVAEMGQALGAAVERGAALHRQIRPDRKAASGTPM